MRRTSANFHSVRNGSGNCLKLLTALCYVIYPVTLLNGGTNFSVFGFCRVDNSVGFPCLYLTNGEKKKLRFTPCSTVASLNASIFSAGSKVWLEKKIATISHFTPHIFSIGWGPARILPPTGTHITLGVSARAGCMNQSSRIEPACPKAAPLGRRETRKPN